MAFKEKRLIFNRSMEIDSHIVKIEGKVKNTRADLNC